MNLSNFTLDDLESVVNDFFEEKEVTRSPVLSDYLEAAELEQIQRVLAEVNGNQRLAARRLGISRTTLWRKLKQAERQKS